MMSKKDRTRQQMEEEMRQLRKVFMTVRLMKADEVHISYLGINALHLGVADMRPEQVDNANECVLRIAIRAQDKAEVEKIIPEISPLQLNGPPGASFFGGRAKATEVIGLYPTLIPRDAVKLTSHIVEVK